MVAIIANGHLRCGGVIISSSHILTAAHCLLGESIPDIFVVAGEHDTTKYDGTEQFIGVSSINIHPGFDPNMLENNIAIITLTGSLQLNNLVQPAKLPFEYGHETFSNIIGTIYGWGTTSFGGSTSNTLQKADINIIANSQCYNYYPTLTSGMLCSYTPGKDACQYDNGGGLFYKINGNNFVIGIISHGQGCASGYPTVYTRVTAYLNWITQIIPEIN